MPNSSEQQMDDMWNGLTKNTAMIVSLVGAVLAIAAAVYVFVFPNEKLGRGVVTLFALFTILIACASVYTTHCVRDGKCYAWSWVYASLTLVMGVLSLIYAFTNNVTTSSADVGYLMDNVYSQPAFAATSSSRPASPAASVRSAKSGRSASKSSPKKTKKKLRR